MAAIRENISLKPYHTFHLAARARYFVEIHSIDELSRLLNSKIFKKQPHVIIGDGSNVLFRQDYDGLVVKMAIGGLATIFEDEKSVQLKIGAGENWAGLVAQTVEQGLYGIENLALIPGTVGAAPVQNIGAYGIEIADVFQSLHAVEIASGQTRIFDRESCRFGYRDSIFKSSQKGRYIITVVILRLSKHPALQLDYGPIRQTLIDFGVSQPTPVDVYQAICRIRQSKLPDPDTIGNAGSFFKNPEISTEMYRQLQSEYPVIPGYPLAGDHFKIPAGWLIEQCGWKGYRLGGAGVHPQQALVLVNYGSATSLEILDLAQQIQRSVWDTFRIELEPEVNIIG